MKLHYDNLTWHRKTWPARTYWAENDTHFFKVDHDGSDWRLRIRRKSDWEIVLYAGRKWNTATELMLLADTWKEPTDG